MREKWRKIENSLERENLENSTMGNVSKNPFIWEDQVSIYRPMSNGHLTSSKRPSKNFFIKQFGVYQQNDHFTQAQPISHGCAKLVIQL